MELHEKILSHLYEQRDTKYYSDIYKVFESYTASQRDQKLNELRAKGLVKIREPFDYGFFILGDNNQKNGGEFDYSRKAMITIDGIEYVKNMLNQTANKNDSTMVINVNSSVINAPLNQSFDDRSFNKTIHSTNNPPKPKETIQKPSTWTLSNISFNLVMGIIITVVGGLIVLIYWERIRHLFE
jgi:hypothetical protein